MLAAKVLDEAHDRLIVDLLELALIALEGATLHLDQLGRQGMEDVGAAGPPDLVHEGLGPLPPMDGSLQGEERGSAGPSHDGVVVVEVAVVRDEKKVRGDAMDAAGQVPAEVRERRASGNEAFLQEVQRL